MNNDDGKALARSRELTDEWTRQAEAAIRETDIAALQKLLKNACEHNAKLSQAFDGLIGLFSAKGEPRVPHTESESAIAAMRDVSLAALALSQSVAQTRSI